MKITTTECTVEEYIELKKAEKETVVNVAIGEINTKAVADMVKEAEFFRKQKEHGRANF